MCNNWVSPLSAKRQAAVIQGQRCNQKTRVNNFIALEFIWDVNTDAWKIHGECSTNV